MDTDGLGTHTVGPLPFGHVSDLPATGWHAAVRALRPDVIYALLNWRAVPFAREVLAAELDVPFVWHFKEAPQRLPAPRHLASTWSSTSDRRLAWDGPTDQASEQRSGDG